MNRDTAIFSQVMDFLPYYEFNRCVQRYNGNYRIRTLPCLKQFYLMAFAQLTFRESLRDIETCLNAMGPKLYHMGIRGTVSRSTLAEANETRDWRIYAEFAQVLISLARPLYANEDIGVDLDQMVYALDSTTIDLCLSLFPWAQFRKRKAAVKLHTLLDIHGPIPLFVWITDGKVHDVNILDLLPVEPGAIYLLDRGYIDFSRLHDIATGNAFFITRAKDNMQYRRLYSNPSDIFTGVLSDQIVALTGFYPSQKYPDKLRRIHYYDAEHLLHLYFLSNNFSLSPVTIGKLFKCRWQIELFFKWIKQHLRIKAFFGLSENAVKTQIWIAICVYVLIAIIKKKVHTDLSLYTILQIISVMIFQKLPLELALNNKIEQKIIEIPCNQLNLFNS